jgi:hypothetical protein
LFLFFFFILARVWKKKNQQSFCVGWIYFE